MKESASKFGTVLPRSFFATDSSIVARQLLGKFLYHTTKDGIVAGLIVETEAYFEYDEASHSFGGPSPRTEVMFGESGHAYVYFTYGMHWCFNVVTGEKGSGQAVLIRALEPTEGTIIMVARRNRSVITDLCSGPAKLTQAMAITKDQNGVDLTKPPLCILDSPVLAERLVGISPRIGISKARDELLRFYIKGNKFVSRKS